MSVSQPIRLTELASCAGCAAKIGADILAQVVSPLRQSNVPAQLLIGLDAIDDGHPVAERWEHLPELATDVAAAERH